MVESFIYYHTSLGTTFYTEDKGSRFFRNVEASQNTTLQTEDATVNHLGKLKYYSLLLGFVRTVGRTIYGLCVLDCIALINNMRVQ